MATATEEFDAIVVREHGAPSVLKLEKKSVPALSPSQVSSFIIYHTIN